MLVYSPRIRIPLTLPGLWLHEDRIKRLNTFKCLGRLNDYRISWRPAVRQTLLQCRRSLEALHRMRGPSWGCAPSCTLRLYKGLTVSCLLYALSLLRIGRPRWDCIETLHRVDSRSCFGVSSYTGNIVTLPEAQDRPSEHWTEEMALLQLHCISQTQPYSSLLRRIRLRSQPTQRLPGQSLYPIVRHSRLGSPKPPPPHGRFPPLIIQGTIAVIARKGDIASVVLRYLAGRLGYCITSKTS